MAHANLSVFLDCKKGSCDRDFIKRELPFIDFVRDRKDSQVHVIVTRQRTAGGRQHELIFYDSEDFQNSAYQLRFASLKTDTKDQIRRGVLAKLQLGLTPYLLQTDLAGSLSVCRLSKSIGKTPPRHASRGTLGMVGFLEVKSALKWKKRTVERRRNIGATFPEAV